MLLNKHFRIWSMGIFVLFLQVLLQGVLAAEGRENLDYCQVILSYDSVSLTVIEPAEIPPMKKKVQTPGLKGAPGTIDCLVDWMDESAGVLATTETKLPVGMRSSAFSGAPRGDTIPEEAVIVIRLAGPKHGKSAPYSIKLTAVQARGIGKTARQTHKAFRDLNGKHLSIGKIKRAGGRPKAEGVVSATKIHDTGIDGNRLVLVVVGNGSFGGPVRFTG